MHIQVPYGKDDSRDVFVPDENVLAVVRPAEVEVVDESRLLADAIENPIRSKSFADFLGDARDVLVVVNDGTRPTPTAKVLDVIRDRLAETNHRFIVATGVHRAPTPEELLFVFGDRYDHLKKRVHVHDCDRKEDMAYLGASRNGTEMHINRLAVEAHKIILISSVEPHYFGGFTGGRKSLLPGLAARETIVQNHKLALEPGARSLALAGNPVHEDMVDAVEALAGKEIFSIQTVSTGAGRVCAATSGNVHASFDAAVEKAKEVFCVTVPGKADVVVSVAPYPMDIDLLQSQKALDNGGRALKDGGILILVSKCRGGIGKSGYFDLLARSETPEQLFDEVGRHYELGYHTAARIAAEIATRAEMWAMTDLADRDVKAIFARPIRDLQEAVSEALAQKGKDARVLFLMEGSITVPVVQT